MLKSWLTSFCASLVAEPGWPSTLFRQSTIGLMEEFAAAGAQTAVGILSSGSFNNLKSEVQEQLLQDPGLGPIQSRGPLVAQIPRDSKEFVPSSFKYKAWVSSISAFKTSYLENWRLEFSKIEYADQAAPRFTGAVPAAEAASFIASHLLHLGPSGSYLSRWINYRATYDPSTLDLNKILEDMEDLAKNGMREAEILIILARPAQDEVRALPGWLNVESVRQWLAEHQLAAPRAIHGGILFKSDQWDLDGALLNVAKAVHRLQKRMTLKTGRAPEFHRSAWILGVKDPRRLPAVSRLGGELMPGYDLGDPQIEATTSDNRLEVAVDLLLAALSEAGPSAAGTLWAALEALLAAPGDPDRGVQVAHRAGDVALVAMIRSSIQMSLGFLFSRCPEEGITQRLRSFEGRDRLVEFEAALRRGDHESLGNRSVRVALSHSRRLLDPDILTEQRKQLQQALLGLYRQRNLVLHGGITDSPLLEGILRSSTPIVTAAINRYARVNGHHILDPHIFAYDMFVRIEGYLSDPRIIIDNFW